MAGALSPDLRRSLTLARIGAKRMPASRRICARRGDADAKINFISSEDFAPHRIKFLNDFARKLSGYAFTRRTPNFVR